MVPELIGAFPPNCRLAALPTWDAPRLLVPVGHSPLLFWKMTSFYPAYRLRAKVFRAITRAAHLPGGCHSLSGLPQGAWALRDFARPVLPEISTMAVRVGTPGPAQKAVAQLWSDRGGLLGYLKIAWTGPGRKRLSEEASLLASLPTGAGPRLLRSGSILNFDALLLEPIPGRPIPLAPVPPPQLQSLVAGWMGDEVFPIAAHPWIARLRNQQTGYSIENAIDALSTRRWPVTLAHGDLAPWNVLQSSDGALRTYDWEYGSTTGFPLADLTFYILQVGANVMHWTPETAAQHALKFLMGNTFLPLSAAEASAVIHLTAFESFLKAADDGHMGSPLQHWRHQVFCANGLIRQT